jgi:hypothetical protein
MSKIPEDVHLLFGIAFVQKVLENSFRHFARHRFVVGNRRPDVSVTLICQSGDLGFCKSAKGCYLAKGVHISKRQDLLDQPCGDTNAVAYIFVDNAEKNAIVVRDLDSLRCAFSHRSSSLMVGCRHVTTSTNDDSGLDMEVWLDVAMGPTPTRVSEKSRLRSVARRKKRSPEEGAVVRNPRQPFRNLLVSLIQASSHRALLRERVLARGFQLHKSYVYAVAAQAIHDDEIGYEIRTKAELREYAGAVGVGNGISG